MPLPQVIRRAAKSLFERCGYDVRKRSNRHRFGEDPVKDVTVLSRALQRPVTTVFDVGANRGAMSEEFLRTFPVAKVYAFEPTPATFALLTARLHDDRLEAVALALSNASGTQQFYDYGELSNINGLCENPYFSAAFGELKDVYPVTTTTVDAFCAEREIERIGLLKIDTEGNELRVLQGAAGMLAAGRIDFIHFEFNDLKERADMAGGSLLAVASYLAPFDFHFIATYTDYVTPQDNLFTVANALVARG